MNKPKLEIIRKIESKVSLEERYNSWLNDFTNPAEGKYEFRYLVHAIGNAFTQSMQSMVLLEQGWSKKDFEKIDLLRDPLRIAEKGVISCSVVDPEHLSTWGDVGLIIKAPPENIFGVYSSDAGTPGFNPKRIKKQDCLPCTVGELLEQTSPTSYNEVVLAGKTNEGEVLVQGFFVKYFPGVHPKFVDPDMANKIFFLARKYSLPVIQIRDNSPKTTPQTTRDGSPIDREFSRRLRAILDGKKV